jgi:hypothetical protein
MAAACWLKAPRISSARTTIASLTLARRSSGHPVFAISPSI